MLTRMHLHEEVHECCGNDTTKLFDDGAQHLEDPDDHPGCCQEKEKTQTNPWAATTTKGRTKIKTGHKKPKLPAHFLARRLPSRFELKLHGVLCAYDGKH